MKRIRNTWLSRLCLNVRDPLEAWEELFSWRLNASAGGQEIDIPINKNTASQDGKPDENCVLNPT